MKRLLLVGLAWTAAIYGVGCARLYHITTNSGRVITTRGKPHYDREHSVFTYQDMRGEQRTISAGSVSQVGPASDTSSPTTFNVKPAR